MQRAEWQLFAILVGLFVVALLATVFIGSTQQHDPEELPLLATMDGWGNNNFKVEEPCDDVKNVGCAENSIMLLARKDLFEEKEKVKKPKKVKKEKDGGSSSTQRGQFVAPPEVAD
jgi:hypothetical protein